MRYLGVLEPPYITSSDGPIRLGRSVAPSDWTLRLSARDLTYIRIDREVHLRFDDIEVSIGTAFELRRGEACYLLDPEIRGDLGPLLALYPTELTASELHADGTLQMSFSCGAAISVSPHPAYEPWWIRGPSEALVVCGPGPPATLAVWA